MHPVRSLENGDWRGARAALAQRGARPSGLDARAAVRVLELARCMGQRALGDVVGALRMADDLAADMAQAGLVHVRTELGPVIVKVASRSDLVGVLARVLWREQHELLRLRKLVADHEDNARECLVLATEEYLTWVDFDPWRGTFLDTDEQSRQVEAEAQKIRARLLTGATGLRRLSHPTRGDISRSVWNDAGDYARLRPLALTRIGHRQAPPWPNAPLPGLLPRTAADLAWRAGRALLSDR